MKRIKRTICLLLCACMVSTGIYVTDVEAANFNDINNSSVFLKQNTNYTCTLASAAMLVRRAAMATGNSNWKNITESSMRGTAWLEGTGLYNTFTYAGITVSSGAMSGNSNNVNQLKSLLASHPEGIVIYDWNIPHAILITDYTNGTFYCADPANNVAAGRIPASSASIAINNADKYWYVSSPKVTLTPTDHAPEGYLDEAKGGVNKIYVKGWAYDPDAKDVPLWIHIYVDGKHVSTTKADKERTDVNNTIGCGKYHGYETTFEYKVGSTGTHKVEVYALNTNTSGVNTRLANSPKTVTVTADTTTPVISNVKVTPSADGYTITCNVTDPEGVDRVQFPTWTLKNGQDDLDKNWQTSATSRGEYKDGKATFKVNIRDHNNEKGMYVTDIYAYNKSGKSIYVRTQCDVDTTPPQTNPFTDVKETDYFYNPVSWAVENGITSGLSQTIFGPEATCTRAQAVTFLWRAAGEPEPASNNNPFADVKSGDYYYKAVLWAVENGVTAGTSQTTFSPNDNCTRGQIVSFLWRSEGEPNPGGNNNPFTDVKSRDYYYKAVLWAVENGVTAGTSQTTFSPNAKCTRGQIVTFLYRYMEE